MNNYKDLIKLKNSKSICLISHINPDPDALASMVVFQDFLKTNYKIKTVDIFAECEELSEANQEILGKIKINTKPKFYDTAIMMDSPNIERIGIYKNLFESANIKIVIDHHATNDHSGEINIVEMQSSTCEIVYSIIRYFGHKITPKNQGKIYAGIITDTNNFTVGNFNKTTFQIVGEIIENVNKEAIYNFFLNKNTLLNMKLQSMAINNIVSLKNGKIIISHITHEEAKENNAKFDSYVGIVNKLASINNNILTCFIYPKDNNYYVSLRAKSGLSIAEVAKSNGGGGHDGAAAFLSNKNLSEIETYIIATFTKLLDKHSPKKYSIF